MSRVQKAKEMKKFRKNVVYPLILFGIIAVILIVIIDVRVNSVLGLGKVRVIKVDNKNTNSVEISILNERIADINLAYIKNDIQKLKQTLNVFVNKYQNDAIEAMKKY